MMGTDQSLFTVGLIIPVFLLVLFVFIFIVKQYKRCPSNRILVIYGKVSGTRAAKCIHGGGVFIIPLIQDFTFLSLEPITIEIDLSGALSKKNIRVNVPSTFTIGISTEPDIMNNAAERLLGLNEEHIRDQARDIILGQLRLVIATLSIEEINQDREKFLELVNKNVGFELNKIGLEVINVNIRDITDESGYIAAIGKKAAAEAINQAKVEVANAEKEGAVGEAVAVREREISVADQSNKAEQGKKLAQKEERVVVANLEAEAIKGENESKASIADYEAMLKERQADAQRKGEVALAEAARDVLIKEKQQEVARLEKVELAQKEVDKRKIEVEAEAEAEKIRRIARGDADAILAKYNAEAEGILNVLRSKATGYKELIDACGGEKHLAPTLLMVEKMPELVAEQVKAIQNLKIDKITVWDSGNGLGEGGGTANFLKSLIGSLPAMHDLASQAGIRLPDVLGKISEEAGAKKLNGHAPKAGDGGPTPPPAPVS